MKPSWSSNRLFREAMDHFGIDEVEVRTTPLAKELVKLLASGVRLERGLMILADFGVRLATAPDLDDTGMERWCNKLHPEDLVSWLTIRDQLVQALCLARELPSHLPEDGWREVQVVISFDHPGHCPPVLSDDPDRISSCVVSIHQVRVGEPFLVEDLETYEHEAVGICTIQSP